MLRPDGLLAAWTYGHVTLDDPRADAILRRFYSETVGPYWPPERALVDDGYRTVELPFEELEPPSFEMRTEWPLEGLLGYVGTWSATSRYREARGVDPLPELRRELSEVWGDPATRRGIGWPLAIRAGRAGA